MPKAPNATALRNLPQIEEVLNHDALKPAIALVGHQRAADAAREAVDSVRQAILNQGDATYDTNSIANDAAARALRLVTQSQRRVINASGVIIHTNLGRSKLAEEAVRAVNEVIRGYSTLEYDMSTMARGSRHTHYEQLVCALTGAEAAIAVNNNAAAVMMVLSEFAAGHEAIISRGELVEIGGSFRIPDIMAQSNARMVEVGTTNKTRISDYERVLSSDTAMFLKVHPSNYRLIGFTESVDIAALRKLADVHVNEEGRRPLVYEDLGSGALVPLQAGDYEEPVVSASIEAGADLVSFSGDKLLGGPQAGIIVGKRELIARLKSNPLARVLRLDKMSLAALEATLRLYLHPQEAYEKIPTLRMLTEDAQRVRERADALKTLVEKAIPNNVATLELVDETSRAGGGALPMCDIPTCALKVSFAAGNAQDCGRYLVQKCPTPIIARIVHEALVCDARTLDTSELEIVADGFARYFESLAMAPSKNG